MNTILQNIQNKFTGLPKGIYVLFYTEMWELFGRFAITAMLVLYLTKTFHFTDSKAFAIYSGFIALIYVTPIIGGIICDRFLNKKFAVIFGGIIMALGNLLLIIPRQPMVFLWPEYYCSR